ncbi:hypothetical protein [Nostoc punctiforme]|nr:hypothetical protein [Nostoc punctiforme]
MSFIFEYLGSSVSQYERLVLSVRLWLGVYSYNPQLLRQALSDRREILAD